MSVITGVILHAIGASSAALCYTPQKRATQWSWQTFWLAQAFVCWLLLPIVGALLTIPSLTEVLREIPTELMLKTFAFGMAYGIGGTAFGIAIRYVGFSLTYAISVGLSCILGTIIPPLLTGQLAGVWKQQGAAYIMLGMAIGVAGIALCGLAGRYKEKFIAAGEQPAKSTFSLSKGLPICLLAGLLSAVYGFALANAQPMADIAARYGAGDFQINIVYLFANSGAFVTSALYCLFLHNKQHTWKQYRAIPDRLWVYYAMAMLTGLLWYGQFFFYGLGHVNMGEYKFSSWAIHMIMLVLFSTVAGLLLKEWAGANNRMRQVLALALVILVVSVLVISYGNSLS
ncbi:L-rhamnose-H+ transport protein [Filimonas lacunae]|uniref:L-rhamnose-H+ transport protein n=1 Tax=Filimonas lacunae TaxID=477680 RepID=A0A173MC39_9BACT|nr:L-rhamnose/proton symporter RhaT [Filimonas lacunae]BAV05154.1 L-rhamnose-proton symporter [Filimonas lacunae]SIT34145.1 L-rhamnose-H+ transport protein [Filimonas lacunae]